MTPLQVVTIAVILVATPLSVGASWFMWHLYAEDRATAIDRERITLTLILALTVTAATVAGVLLAIPTGFFLLGIDGTSHQWIGQLVLVAIDILLIAPILIAGYLRWRRG